VIAASLAAGMRIAAQVEQVSGAKVFIVSCKSEVSWPMLRWPREFAQVCKFLSRKGLLGKLWNYGRSGRLIILDYPLEYPASVARLRALECDVGLHASNVIYRAPVITLGFFPAIEDDP
jgi:hypothetical protein